jgi:hypothetical protein
MVMTPTATDLLNGCIQTLVAPPRPEDAGVFLTARMRTVALINRLVALECESGSAVRVAENAAIRLLLAQAGSRYEALASAAAVVSDGDYSTEALDAANARLRRLLIELHEAVELAGDKALDRKIIKLYREIAERRELKLPPAKPA